MNYFRAAILSITIYQVGCVHEKVPMNKFNLGQDGLKSEGMPSVPPSRREESAEFVHGVRLVDPYRWLEDGSSEEVRRWVDAQDRYAREKLSKYSRRSSIEQRVRELIYVEERSAPIERNGRLFYWVKSPSQERAIYYWQEGKIGEPRVLIDPNPTQESTPSSVTAVVPSNKGRFIAYKEKVDNRDEATLQIMEVDTGKVRTAERIDHLMSEKVSWLPDESGFYYVWMPQSGNMSRNDWLAAAEVRFHRLGAPAKDDITVWPATGDSALTPWAEVTGEGRFLVLYVEHGFSGREVYIKRLDVPDAPIVPLAKDGDAHYAVVASRERLFVMTDSGASRYRVFAVDPDKLSRKDWREIIPERTDVTLDYLDMVGGNLLLRTIQNACNGIELWSESGELLRSIQGPELGTIPDITTGSDKSTVYFTFESFSRPRTVFQYSVGANKPEIFAKTSVDVDPSEIKVEQVFYPSKDGTSISMFLVSKRGFQKQQKNPTLLDGYGGAAISITPAFSARIIAWVEAGGLYVIPNLRGGGEYGEDWHRAGMLGKKQNVFDDFIAAAEWLIAHGYATASSMAIRGGSNGGLLVGAVMTQRPELFSVVVCAVPLLDMIRYTHFGIGKSWIPEYGDPEREEDFRWLLSYSPYHHISPRTAYPALLVLTAENDDRVDPMHARKFLAAMQWAQSSKRPMLLRVERNAGHEGGDLRTKRASQIADELAFALSELGKQ